MEKSVPHNHCLSSHGKPRQASGCLLFILRMPIVYPRDEFFNPTLTLMMDSYIPTYFFSLKKIAPACKSLEGITSSLYHHNVIAVCNVFHKQKHPQTDQSWS